jgi:hypothetical protein
MEDEDGAPLHMAEVPNLGRPIKGDGDFVALNKMLRACFVCRLIKTERQVRGGRAHQAAPAARDTAVRARSEQCHLVLLPQACYARRLPVRSLWRGAATTAASCGWTTTATQLQT